MRHKNRSLILHKEIAAQLGIKGAEHAGREAHDVGCVQPTRGVHAALLQRGHERGGIGTETAGNPVGPSRTDGQLG